MNCEYIDEGCCTVIETITNTPYFPQKEECRACSKCSVPCGINEITKTISNSLLQETKKPGLFTGRGPGSRLAYIISWFHKSPPGCNCADRAAIMDVWGIEGCRERRKTIIHWLEESAHISGIPTTRLMLEGLVTALLLTPYFQTPYQDSLLPEKGQTET